ncbi:MAG: DUF4421 domain-containing protein [Reichenbachiella sp.]
MLRTLLLLVFALLHLVSQDAQAQFHGHDSSNYKHDNKYVKDYSDKLSLNLLGVLKSNEIAHHDGVTNQDFKYKPNEVFNLGFGVQYKWLGIELAFNIPAFNDDDHIYGNTKHFDLQSNIYTTHFVIDLVYQRYKGYYASNQASYDTLFNPDEPVYSKRSDISTKSYGFHALYIVNSDRFSYRAAFTFNERQVKSAGTFLFGLYFNRYLMNADSTIVPVQYQDQVDQTADFRNTRHYTFGGSGGYAYNLVLFHRVFASASAVLGIGPQILAHHENQHHGNDTDYQFAAFIAFRAAIGYNGPKFYAGVSAFATSNGGQDNDESYLTHGINNFKIHIGRRFSVGQ